MADTALSEYKIDNEGTRKRRKLFGEERLHRNRERNKLHARKTRERKKQQLNALQCRLSVLETEGTKLRQTVDDRYTANVLLGLSQTFQNSLGENHNILSSANICNEASLTNAASQGAHASADGTVRNFSSPHDVDEMGDKKPELATEMKRMRRRGKYTPQERERIRRERNRMHAKRTRDRKKKLLEDSENIITRMEWESHLLRGYCVSVNMLSAEDATKLEERASESKRELAALKASQGEYDVDCDEDDDNDYNNNEDNGDGDDEHDNDGSLSGSDDNEKSSSWNGSNHGNDSVNGDTSGDARSSDSSGSSSSGNSSNDNHCSSNMSSNIGTGSSGSSRSQNSSGSGSGSGGDSPVPKHAGNDWKEEKSFNYGAKPPHIKPPSSYSTMQQHVKGVYPTHTGLVSSTHSDTISRQSVESYNHGGMMASSIAPSPTPTATKAGSSNADSTVTLRTADCYKPLTTCAPQAWKHPANRSALTQAGAPCEGYSLSLGPQVKATYSATEQPGLKKLKNIVLSVIAPGVLAPRGPGDTSPQGLFTPNPTLRNSQVMQQESANRRNHDDKGNFIHGFRNLPSSNSSNASEPL